MSKHFWLAIVMVPFLGYVGYALTDWYLKKETPHTELKIMKPVHSDCALTQGCQFYAGDFVITVKQTAQAIQFTGNQRLKGLMVEVVKVAPPQRAEKVDEAGYQWRLSIPKALPKGVQLRWVAQGYWGNYIGETP
ncbi:hypothetical protein [Galenea microaerophila]